MGYSFALALVGDILYNVDFYRTLRMSFFVATTIGRANMMAILEVEEHEEAQKGEVKLSLDCVNKNLETGLFKDMTDSIQNAIGKVYILASDLPNN
mgnify:CR=1 FL=1